MDNLPNSRSHLDSFRRFVELPDVTMATIVIGLMVCTLLSLFLHLLAFQGAFYVPSDTNDFLRLVALIRGEQVTMDRFPLHIGNPLYAVFIYFVDIVLQDWLASARLCAMLPSILTASVITCITWKLDHRYWSGILAGVVMAISWPLIDFGTVPLADSTFVFFSALSILFGVHLLSDITLRRAALFGIFAGLAWSTKGPGFFFLFAILICMFVRWRFNNKNNIPPAHSGQTSERTLSNVLPVAVMCVIFIAVGRGPTWILYSMTSDLKPAVPYSMLTVYDGRLIALTSTDREREMYSLNESCSDFKYKDVLATITWLELIKEHWRVQAKVFAFNLARNLGIVLPSTLQPFFLLFFPLSLGIVSLWQRRTMKCSCVCLLLLYALLYILFIPMIVLKPRYIYPIAVVAIPVVGIGLAELWRGEIFAGISNSRGYLCRILTVILLATFILYGIGRAYRKAMSSSDIGYQKASEWLIAHSDKDAYVMSRYHGVYAYTKRKKLSLPVDPLKRVAKYIRYTETRYLVIGPKERHHTKEALHFPMERGKSIYVGGVEFATVQTYGETDNNRVLVIEARY